MTSAEMARKIRRHAVRMTHRSQSSHIGAALSIADIVAVLYSGVMNVFPNKPLDGKRDRFVLSKGHAGVAVYAALAEKGFFPVEDLTGHCANGSLLSGHISHLVPGVELSTGSLGHGISVACGMALAAKQDGKQHRVYVLIGDGECNEGTVWEAALFGNHFRLCNFTVIVDHNKLQSLGRCEDTIELLDLGAKWRAFGWDVREVDGHCHDELNTALACRGMDRPCCVVAHTTKGKGISFMENSVLWHYRPPQGAEYENALAELEAAER